MNLLLNIVWNIFTFNQTGLLSGGDDKLVKALLTDFRSKPLSSLLLLNTCNLIYFWIDKLDTTIPAPKYSKIENISERYVDMCKID